MTSPRKAAAGCVIVARRTGRVLFCLRSRDVPSGGVWGTWGGKAEGGETAAQTALREVAEETGLAGDGDLMHLHRMKSPTFSYDTFLMVVDDEFCPAIGPEADGYAWLPLDRAPAPLHWGFSRLLSDPAARRRLAREIERVSGRPCSLAGADRPSRRPPERREGAADRRPAAAPPRCRRRRGKGSPRVAGAAQAG